MELIDVRIQNDIDHKFYRGQNIRCWDSNGLNLGLEEEINERLGTFSLFTRQSG